MKSLFDKGINALRRYSLSLLIVILLPTFGMSNFSDSAKFIYASYSTRELTIPVKALEEWVKNDVIVADSAVYQRYLPAAQIQELRQVLMSPIKVHPVAVSQFLSTAQGELMLQKLAGVIHGKFPQPQVSSDALRLALMKAAQEPGGLTLLNVLRNYPHRSVHIDLTQTLDIAAELKKLVDETNYAVMIVTKKSDGQGTWLSSEVEMLTQSSDLSHQGNWGVEKQTLNFFDSVRQRLLVTDVYLAQGKHDLPVIVIDHGVGTDSSNFAYLGSHLASHGFAVVVPTHPVGNHLEVGDEFYQRPLDIKYILDRLEVINQGRLNLQQVGVFGQSLGGYTALALAGAKINFEQIAKNCDRQTLETSWNLSLLFQCGARELRNQEHNLQDERVKAVIAVNPITSTIFGEAGLSHIHVPVMMVASSDDTVAPALYEQILPFASLVNPHKYLALLVGGTHFSVIGEGSNSQPRAVPSELIGDNPQEARRYMQGLSVPFFQTYVAENFQYSGYLNAAEIKATSHQSMGLSLVRNLTINELLKMPDN
jgi:predicted dienelactone hydrolase